MRPLSLYFACALLVSNKLSEAALVPTDTGNVLSEGAEALELGLVGKEDAQALGLDSCATSEQEVAAASSNNSMNSLTDQKELVKTVGVWEGCFLWLSQWRPTDSAQDGRSNEVMNCEYVMLSKEDAGGADAHEKSSDDYVQLTDSDYAFNSKESPSTGDEIANATAVLAKDRWKLAPEDFNTLSSLAESSLSDSIDSASLLGMLAASSIGQFYKISLSLSSLTSTLLFEEYCDLHWEDTIVQSLKQKIPVSEDKSIAFGRLLAEMFVKVDSVRLFDKFVVENKLIRAYFYISLAASHGSLKVLEYFSKSKNSATVSWSLSKEEFKAINSARISVSDPVVALFNFALVKAVDAAQLNAVKIILRYGANPEAITMSSIMAIISSGNFQVFKELIAARPNLVNEEVFGQALHARSDKFALYLLNYGNKKLAGSSSTLFYGCTSELKSVREACLISFKSVLTTDMIVNMAVKYMNGKVDNPEVVMELVGRMTPTHGNIVCLVRAAFSLENTLKALLGNSTILNEGSWESLVNCTVVAGELEALKMVVKKFPAPIYQKKLCSFFKAALEGNKEPIMLVLVSNAAVDKDSARDLLNRTAAKNWWEVFKKLALRVRTQFTAEFQQGIMKMAIYANQVVVVKSLAASGYQLPRGRDVDWTKVSDEMRDKAYGDAPPGSR